MQATMARLGSKMTFREAVEEVWYAYHTRVSEATVRRTTHRHGAAAEALVRQEVEMLERDMPEATARPQQLLVSVDGAFVRLTSGEWREVKSMVVGEFRMAWDPASWQRQVKTEALSYFSRSYGARDFERYAWSELHRRGLQNAQMVVTVSDGAAWIQSFIDYHCPTAQRILDFAHAAAYLAQAGKAVWGEESETFRGWFASACRGLKHEPPTAALGTLRLLQAKAKTDEQATQIDSALSYLQSRLHMLDYAHFRRRGFPIGSGSVESGHKVVVQRRMKGAGMRWAEQHLDPMLALRNMVCNDRWEEGWQQIVLFHHEQQVTRRILAADAKQPPSTPLTFKSLKAAGLLPEDDQPDQTTPPNSSGPSPDHPWRNNKWPTREAWRWN